MHRIFNLVFFVLVIRYSVSHCYLHERVFDFLQQPVDTSQSPEDHIISLHKALIDGYSHRCQKKWSTHPDDGYYYQNLTYHLKEALDNNTLNEVIHDFNWVVKKITLCGEYRQELQKLLDHCFNQKQMQVFQLFQAIVILVHFNNK